MKDGGRGIGVPGGISLLIERSMDCVLKVMMPGLIRGIAALEGSSCGCDWMLIGMNCNANRH